jgi:hypothetical protein
VLTSGDPLGTTQVFSPAPDGVYTLPLLQEDDSMLLLLLRLLAPAVVGASTTPACSWSATWRPFLSRYTSRGACSRPKRGWAGAWMGCSCACATGRP